MLTANRLCTVGDHLKYKEELYGGFPGGSPLTPTLFNLYADKLAHRLQKIPQAVSSWLANLFADDVQLVAKTLAGLQNMLHICTAWADQYGMTRAPQKSKILTNALPDTPLLLARTALPVAEDTTYLGLSIDCHGVRVEATSKILKAAKKRVNQLRSIGVFYRTHLRLKRNIFLALIRPMYEYGLHLGRLTSSHTLKANKIEFSRLSIPLRNKLAQNLFTQKKKKNTWTGTNNYQRRKRGLSIASCS